MSQYYVQSDGDTFVGHIHDIEPTRWDEDNFCRVAKLTPEQIEQFGVHQLKLVTPPYYDPATQFREHGPALLIDGVWTQNYIVRDLIDDEFVANAARIKNEIKFATQQRLDAFAQTREYDGILSACTYATSVNAKFAAEGQYCVEARDATWSQLYVIMTGVEAGERPMPASYYDIEAELPSLEWPHNS